MANQAIESVGTDAGIHLALQFHILLAISRPITAIIICEKCYYEIGLSYH